MIWTKKHGFGKPDLSFICVACEAALDETQIIQGCPQCEKTMFRVARKSTPLMQEPQVNTNRPSMGDEEDGYKFTTPGTAGEIGESGLGDTNFRGQAGYNEFQQNNYLPTDGDAFDRNIDGGNTDSLNDVEQGINDNDVQPLNPFRQHQKGPDPVGPFNMNRMKPFRGISGDSDLFERLRQKRKEFR